MNEANNKYLTLIHLIIKSSFGRNFLYAISLSLLTSSVAAHDNDAAGLEICLEGNLMVADAQNAPFAEPGPGRVFEMNIMTGDLGVTFQRPASDPTFPSSGPGAGAWKPTGVLSGGVSGHAFINSAAWHVVSEFHRDGEHEKSRRLVTAPPFSAGPGAMPRLLGSQIMPNGNIVVAVCDANFNDPTVFPPLSSSPVHAANSRLLVLDPESLKEIDEYSMPDDARWTCAAGIIFADDGMYVSMFHGAAVFVVDWEDGAKNIRGPKKFHLNHPDNVAKIERVIDMYPGAAADDPRRRDSLRAISFDGDGNLYATNRARAEEPITDSSGFRQHVAIVPSGASAPTGTIAMDHSVQVIAGLRTNRISMPGCAKIRETNPSHPCNIETLYVAASGTGDVMEYLIDSQHLDKPDCRDLNTGCAQPIARFFNQTSSSGQVQPRIDPRMLMTIHEAFVQ